MDRTKGKDFDAMLRDAMEVRREARVLRAVAEQERRHLAELRREAGRSGWARGASVQP